MKSSFGELYYNSPHHDNERYNSSMYELWKRNQPMILYVLRAVKNILYNHQNLIQSIKTFAEDFKKFYLGIMTCRLYFLVSCANLNNLKIAYPIEYPFTEACFFFTVF